MFKLVRDFSILCIIICSILPVVVVVLGQRMSAGTKPSFMFRNKDNCPLFMGISEYLFDTLTRAFKGLKLVY